MTDQSVRAVAIAPDRAGRALKTISFWVVGSLAVFAILEWATRLEIVPAIYFPYASTVARRIPELLGDRVFVGHVGSTLVAWFLALTITVVDSLGVPASARDAGTRHRP
jgi:ABC-type nitrate/sulfonate/bicarbonate transport system permease component